ncbi:MAG: serine/threonine protein kinase [Planctomycetes bacterium]|nr:serine/threonine protein kinase [Planctomycetota bacterium]
MSTPAIGNYQVIGTLGEGAHSTILHIRSSNDGKQYALKVVPINTKSDQKYLEQAQHEFRVAQMLSHSNLIKVHALETPRDWLFRIRKVHLLIEYVKGQTVDSIKGLSVPRLVQVFAHVAAGLSHMHARGVYHADLKPGNILVSRTGDVKIIDFGLAWVRGQNKERIQGTPEYMAPETARKSVVNERTDIYNFGATMYRLTTWRLPPLAITQNVRQPVEPVNQCNPQAPEALCELIHQCLEFTAIRRPKTMSEVQKALEALVQILVRRPEDRLEAMEW